MNKEQKIKELATMGHYIDSRVSEETVSKIHRYFGKEKTKSYMIDLIVAKLEPYLGGSMQVHYGTITDYKLREGKDLSYNWKVREPLENQDIDTIVKIYNRLK
jgi:hypothetical protein